MSEMEKEQIMNMAGLMAQAQEKAKEETAIYVKGCIHGAEMAIGAMKKQMEEGKEQSHEMRG